MDRLEKKLKEQKITLCEEYKKIRDKTDSGKFFYHKYEVVCETCGFHFKARAVEGAAICRKCYPMNESSKIQTELREFLIQSIGEESVFENNREVIFPFEIDLYILSKRIGFEINGNYYRSEISGRKNKKYHITKTQKANEKNVKLIQIFEDEWILKKDIVKSRIKNILGIEQQKIFARNCIIKEVSFLEAKEFNVKNHIQGHCVDKIRLGLYYKSVLVSLMTFGKERKALGISDIKEGVYELLRFSSKINYTILGGFNKILYFFVKNYQPKKIKTYADCRWSGMKPENTIYGKTGFVFLKFTQPSYFYVHTSDYMKRMHRFSLNKQVLIKKFNGDKNKKEFEIAVENGYDRIWDCGAMHFELDFI